MASEQLLKVIGITAEIYGKSFSVEAALVLAADLDQFPEPAVLAALSRCRKELRNFPTLSEIIDRIDDGRPGPQEAWAMIPKDESGSVVWTDEMAEAFGVARQLENPIEARMAFLESYKTLLAASRNANKPPNWTPSLGTDPGGRSAALTEAVSKGRMLPDRAAKLIPELPTWTHAKVLEFIQKSNQKQLEQNQEQK